MGRARTWVRANDVGYPMSLSRDIAASFHRRRGALTALLAGGVLAACAVGGPSLPTADITGSLPSAGMPGAPPAGGVAKAKVAMILPLSGPGALANVAKAMKQAGEMALFDKSGVELQLIVKDDLGTEDGAKAAATEALKEGAELILGPLLAASVQTVAPIAAAAGVPVIAFSNDRRVAGNGVYLLSFMPEQDTERMVSHALSQGKRNIAALLPDDAYGRIVEQAFTSALASGNGNAAGIERYKRSGSGMLEATRRLGEALAAGGDGAVQADAVLVPADAETLTSLGPLIAYARIDPTRIKLLGSGGWDAPNIGRDATFVGAWFPAPDPRGWQTFAEGFAKTFGNPPPRIASVAHDAVGIAATLAKSAQPGRFGAANITRAAGFTGVDGQVRIKADGTSVRALAILEVQAFGSNVVDPAKLPPEAGGAAGAAAAPSVRSSQVN